MEGNGLPWFGPNMNVYNPTRLKIEIRVGLGLSLDLKASWNQGHIWVQALVCRTCLYFIHMYRVYNAYYMQLYNVDAGRAHQDGRKPRCVQALKLCQEAQRPHPSQPKPLAIPTCNRIGPSLYFLSLILSLYLYFVSFSSFFFFPIKFQVHVHLKDELIFFLLYLLIFWKQATPLGQGLKLNFRPYGLYERVPMCIFYFFFFLYVFSYHQISVCFSPVLQ